MEGNWNTQGNIWFVIAVMEFCAMIIIFLAKMFLLKISKARNASSGLGGTIKIILEATHKEDEQREENDTG